MGTEPARLQERLEAALGPAWAIERELGGGMSRVVLVNDARLGRRIVLRPEQVTGDPAMVHCADLYALGMMAYELLMGSHPFAGRADHAAVAAHLTEAPTPLSERRPVGPPSAAAVVMRLLAKHDSPRHT